MSMQRCVKCSIAAAMVMALSTRHKFGQRLFILKLAIPIAHHQPVPKLRLDCEESDAKEKMNRTVTEDGSPTL